MKIGELVKQTQVSKETIHYYVREGLLPRPRKLAKNVADYEGRAMWSEFVSSKSSRTTAFSHSR